MTAAAGVPARRLIALAAVVAIVVHAFGMGVLGPRMAAASRIVASVAAPLAAEHCPHHAHAVDSPDADQHGSGTAGHEHSPEEHPPSCEACPLGQSGMALAPPPATPVVGAVVHVVQSVPAARLVILEAWRHRSPPARAPPGPAAA